MRRCCCKCHEYKRIGRPYTHRITCKRQAVKTYFLMSRTSTPDNAVPNWSLLDEIVWEEFDRIGDYTACERQSPGKGEQKFKTGEFSGTATCTNNAALANLNSLAEGHSQLHESQLMSQAMVFWSGSTSSNTISEPMDGLKSNLVDYGWQSAALLQDIDKLFMDNDALLSQAFDDRTDGMLWEYSSLVKHNAENTRQMMKSPVIPSAHAFDHMPNENLISVKLENGSVIDKVTPFLEEIPYDSVQDLSISCVKEENSSLCHNAGELFSVKLVTPSEVRAPSTGQNLMSTTKEDTNIDIRKSQQAPRQSRRRDGRVRKQALTPQLSPLHGRKLQVTDSIPLSSTSPKFVPPISLSHSTHTVVCETPNTIPSMPPLSCVNGSFEFHVHNLPIMVQQVHAIHPSYHESASSTLERLSENSKCHPEQAPTDGSNMTPQEKIEKLQQRQKLWAQLAIEQQQYCLVKQQNMPTQNSHQPNTLKYVQEAPDAAIQGIPSHIARPTDWKEGLVSEIDKKQEEEDESLAANVLQRLLNIASELDVRLKLCLRDGFHRLAKSATQRQAPSDVRNKDTTKHPVQNSTDLPPCLRTPTVADIVEAGTNPIDRFIAHLLFYKQDSAPMEHPLLTGSAPSMNNPLVVAETSTVSATLQEASDATCYSLAYTSLSEKIDIPMASLTSSFPALHTPVCESKNELLGEFSFGHCTGMEFGSKCFSDLDNLESEMGDVGMCSVHVSDKSMSLEGKSSATEAPSGLVTRKKQGSKMPAVTTTLIKFMDTAAFNISLLDVKDDEPEM